MSYLEKLLPGIVVEWKSLGEVTDILTGGEPPLNSVKSHTTDNTYKYPIYGNGADVYGFADSYRIDKDAVTISSIGSNTGKIYFRRAFFTPIIRLKVVIPKNDSLLPKYIYHYLTSIKISSKKSSVPNMSASDVKKIQIAIPPLKAQKEIVRILDAFSELKAELTSKLNVELTARNHQYSYYREQLFCFNENEVQHLPMGDESIGKFIRGGGLQKKDLKETGVGCIHYGQIYTYYRTYTDKTKSFVSEEFAKKARMAKHGDLVIATTSENDEDVCKAVAWLGIEEIAVSSDACFYSHKLNPKFVAYFFQTEQFQKQKRPFITGTKVRRVNVNDLAKIKIPVPSKEKQQRIVSILDKFDMLTTSISEGLPKEIELRKKQYEYYRDLLLTFPQDN